MPSPACLVKDGSGSFVATTGGVNVTAGNTITVQLSSETGVRTWTLEVFGVDELSSAPVLTFSAGPPLQYTFTFPNASGRSIGLRSTINGGVDVNGVAQESYVSTFGCFTLVSGLRTLFSGETGESNAAGWIADFNAFIRTGGGTGFVAGTDLASIDASNQKVVGFNAEPLNTADAVGDKKLWVWEGSSSHYRLRQLTSNDLAANFSVSLALASGSATPLEIGTTWTPTFNATPATNSASVSGCTVQDNRGNGPTSISQANPISAPVLGGSYTSANTTAIDTPGTTVAVSVSETQVSPSQTATGTYTMTYEARVFSGFGASTTATGLTQSGGNATVVGPTASLTGQLAASLVGQTTLFGSMTPSNNYLWLAWHSSFGGTHTFKDKLTGFAIDMQAPVLVTTTTQSGVSCSYYVARSTNNLGTTAIEPYFDS